MEEEKTQPVTSASSRQLPWVILLVLILILIGQLFWQTYLSGQRQGGYFSEQMNEQLLEQQRKLEEQAQLLSDTRRKLNRYQRSAQIEAEANRRLQKDLLAFKNELQAVQAEADILRKLISENRASLYVKDFKLRYRPSEQIYAYSFIIAQALEEMGSTRGQLLITIVGQQSGKQRVLSRDEFSGSGEKALKLNFKHYQKVIGKIRLPGDFMPEFIHIEAHPNGRKSRKMSWDFVWQTDNS